MTSAAVLAADRLRPEGIKLSLELVQINRFNPAGQDQQGAGRLVRFLAEQRINLSFLFISATPRGLISSLGLESEDFDRVEPTLRGDPNLSPGLETIRPVGTVTLFPHRFDLDLLGRVLGAWGQTGFPLHGMGTSISTVTISTDYRLLDRAGEALITLLGLPDKTVPQRPEFRVKPIR